MAEYIKKIRTASGDKQIDYTALANLPTNATTSVDGLMSASDKSKLNGIAANANNYSLPTASASTLGGIKVGANLTITNGILSADAQSYSDVTTTTSGLMTAADKVKLDGIAAGANAYSLPTASSSTLGGVKTGSNITNSSGTISITKDNVTAALGYTPPTTNTTYSNASSSAAGLMSASDKSKLDGIASGANAYSLPTASSSTLGGVKTTSTVTSTSGLTACPIISGVPYYKDTNSTYTLSSFGITATATELNYTDGVTSNIQTQLNGKLSLSGGTMTGALTTTATLTTKNSDGGDCSYTLDRSHYANWRLLSSSGNLYFQSDYTTSKTSYYNVLTLNYNSGNATVKGSLTASSVYGAVWNDYAEYRRTNEPIKAGYVICENGDDTLSLSTERLQAAPAIVSDTFGFAIGETEEAKTPIAVSGRVLAYTYEPRESYLPGDAVCAAPGGTVSKMTREEIINYPERIVGIVSAIPDYEAWGENNVSVNGRIWIKVK